MPAFATALSSASGTEPSGSQPLRGAPTPAHDSETVDGGIGKFDVVGTGTRQAVQDRGQGHGDVRMRVIGEGDGP